MNGSKRLAWAIAALLSALPAGAVQPVIDPETGRPDERWLLRHANPAFDGRELRRKFSVEAEDQTPVRAVAGVAVEDESAKAARLLDVEPIEPPLDQEVFDDRGLAPAWARLEKGGDLEDRLDAVRQLRRSPRSLIVELRLLAILQDDGEPAALRVECARALRGFRKELRVIMNEPSYPPAVRRAAAWAALRGQTGWFSPEAFVALGRYRHLLGDPAYRNATPHDASKRLLALYRIKSDDAADALIQLSLSPSPSRLEKASALWNLGRLRQNERARRILAKFAIRHKDPLLRAVAAEALLVELEP